MLWSRRTSLVLVLAVALLGSGCGTVQNIKCPAVAPADNPNARVCRIYGGVRDDWAIISEYPLSETTNYADYVIIPVLATMHLAFSAAGDTVTLPYTAYEEIRRALYRPGAQSEFRPAQSEFSPTVINEVTSQR